MNRGTVHFICTLAVLLALGAPRPAGADWVTGTTKVFSLAWNTVANWSQVGIDGGQVSGSGVVDGNGSVTVKKLADHYEFGFDFYGNGRVVPGGTFAPGAKNWDGAPLATNAMWLDSYPVPAGSLVEPVGDFHTSSGTWSLEGDSALSISYTDAPHSNTFGVNGWSHLEGTGTASVSVSEPAVLVIVAAGLLLAARLASRRVDSRIDGEGPGRPR